MKAVLIFASVVTMTATASAADLADRFKQVCDSPAVKSEKLVSACQADEAPEHVKAGDRFKNVGIGAEVNTLAANLAFFRKS